jgi:DNA-binding CsgD family transcriptional regulator
LQALFALTPSEAQIVVDLMQGLAPQTIAQNRRNSIHTIRAHIRQCHQKIGVNNREELLSRIYIACA